MAIRHWPKDQRPREKLLLKGAQHLPMRITSYFFTNRIAWAKRDRLSEPAIGSFWRHRAASQSRSKQF